MWNLGVHLIIGFHLHKPFDLLISDYVELDFWYMGALLHVACLRSVLCKVLEWVCQVHYVFEQVAWRECFLLACMHPCPSVGMDVSSATWLHIRSAANPFLSILLISSHFPFLEWEKELREVWASSSCECESRVESLWPWVLVTVQGRFIANDLLSFVMSSCGGK